MDLLRISYAYAKGKLRLGRVVGGDVLKQVNSMLHTLTDGRFKPEEWPGAIGWFSTVRSYIGTRS